MKKIKLSILTVLTVIVTGMVFVSCESDNDLLESKSTESLFSKLSKLEINNEQRIGKNGGYIIKEFTEAMYTLNVQKFKIISSRNNRIKFKVEAGNVNFNGKPLSINNKTYTLKKDNNNFMIKSGSLKIKYTPSDNTILLISPTKTLNIINCDGTEFTKKTSDDFCVLLFLLNEMLIENQPKNEISKLDPGTYLYGGAHLDLGSANYACGRDYNQVIANNPNCSSPGGFTVSCLFDNHFCFCTATFYCI